MDISTSMLSFKQINDFWKYPDLSDYNVMLDQISELPLYCATIFQGIGFDMSNEKRYQPNERDFWELNQVKVLVLSCNL